VSKGGAVLNRYVYNHAGERVEKRTASGALVVAAASRRQYRAARRSGRAGPCPGVPLADEDGKRPVGDDESPGAGRGRGLRGTQQIAAPDIAGAGYHRGDSQRCNPAGPVHHRHQTQAVSPVLGSAAPSVRPYLKSLKSITAFAI
jgi:hypothetical protein